MSCASDRCSGSGDVRLSDKSVGGTYRFEFPLTKNDDVWTEVDSVAILFVRPDGTTVGPYECTLIEPDEGVWFYQTVPTDLDTVGYWSIRMTVTDGPVEIVWPYEIAFRVR